MDCLTNLSRLPEAPNCLTSSSSATLRACGEVLLANWETLATSARCASMWGIFVHRWNLEFGIWNKEQEMRIIKNTGFVNRCFWRLSSGGWSMNGFEGPAGRWSQRLPRLRSGAHVVRTNCFKRLGNVAICCLSSPTNLRLIKCSMLSQIRKRIKGQLPPIRPQIMHN